MPEQKQERTAGDEARTGPRTDPEPQREPEPGTGFRPESESSAGPGERAAPAAPDEEPVSEPVTEPVPEPPRATAAPDAGASDAPGTAELEDRWRRALADVDNLRKRHARDRPRELEAERARVAAAWLPVVDNLELALAHAGADPGAIVEGVQAVRDQAVDVLKRLGYPRHDETGVPFDPLRHDVVSAVDAPDTAPGTVVQVLRPGYGEPDRQLRPAAVAVSREQE